MAPHSTVRTVALTVVTLVAFAANSVLCRLALRGPAVDPLTFTALRLASGALVLLPFLPTRGAPSSSRWSARSALALLAYALGFSLAYVWLDTGTGALLLFGAVQVTMIAAGLRAGERPTPLRVLGIVAAVAGVVALVAPGVTAPEPLGALLMVAAGVAWGVYSLLGRGVQAPKLATARNFLLAAPVALLALPLAPDQLQLSPQGIALAVTSGALTSGLGYVVWYAALRGHSATSAAVVQLAVPVLAAAGGVALLGEEPTTRLVVAGALTLGGVLVAVLARRPAGATGARP
jgi:drug/metabolite transporter (DMT)-like permease